MENGEYCFCFVVERCPHAHRHRTSISALPSVSPAEKLCWLAPCHLKCYPVSLISLPSISWTSSIFLFSTYHPYYVVKYLFSFSPIWMWHSWGQGLWHFCLLPYSQGLQQQCPDSACSINICWYMNECETSWGNLTQAYVAGDELVLGRERGASGVVVIAWVIHKFRFCFVAWMDELNAQRCLSTFIKILSLSSSDIKDQESYTLATHQSEVCSCQHPSRDIGGAVTWRRMAHL